MERKREEEGEWRGREKREGGELSEERAQKSRVKEESELRLKRPVGVGRSLQDGQRK